MMDNELDRNDPFVRRAVAFLVTHEILRNKISYTAYKMMPMLLSHRPLWFTLPGRDNIGSVESFIEKSTIKALSAFYSIDTNGEPIKLFTGGLVTEISLCENNDIEVAFFWHLETFSKSMDTEKSKDTSVDEYLNDEDTFKRLRNLDWRNAHDDIFRDK